MDEGGVIGSDGGGCSEADIADNASAPTPDCLQGQGEGGETARIIVEGSSPSGEE